MERNGKALESKSIYRPSDLSLLPLDHVGQNTLGVSTKIAFHIINLTLVIPYTLATTISMTFIVLQLSATPATCYYFNPRIPEMQQIHDV